MKIYIFTDYSGDIRFANIEVYELDHETDKMLFLKCRSGTRLFRKGKRRAGDLSGPDPWFRTEDEAVMFWEKEVMRQTENAKGELKELKLLVTLPFHYIPVDIPVGEPEKKS